MPFSQSKASKPPARSSPRKAAAPRKVAPHTASSTHVKIRLRRVLQQLYVCACWPMIIETQFVSKMFDRTKIQTRRVYQQSTANIFAVSSRLKLLVPVWARGYGHRFTIGHILITHIYKQKLHELSVSDMVLEGLPDMSVDDFVSNLARMSNHKITMQTSVYVYTFVFFPLSQKR